jgi:hypothetical protein
LSEALVERRILIHLRDPRAAAFMAERNIVYGKEETAVHPCPQAV